LLRIKVDRKSSKTDHVKVASGFEVGGVLHDYITCQLPGGTRASAPLPAMIAMFSILVMFSLRNARGALKLPHCKGVTLAARIAEIHSENCLESRVHAPGVHC
jgi:hypothetical protein